MNRIQVLYLTYCYVETELIGSLQRTILTKNYNKRKVAFAAPTTTNTKYNNQMIAQADKEQYYTFDEYLELEVNSQERHEYIDGEIILMTGGTPNHNRIALNFSGALNTALQQPYETFVADQKLWIPKKRINTYPDVMVVEGELQLLEGRRDTITNPLMIAEVLSESTRAYDKDEKFAAYRTIPGFKEYILIDQYTVHVEQYYKTEGKSWMFTEYDDLNETLSLKSIPFQVMLGDIYKRVKFD